MGRRKPDYHSLDVACPTCGAREGRPCRHNGKLIESFHKARRDKGHYRPPKTPAIPEQPKRPVIDPTSAVRQRRTLRVDNGQ